jgi:CHAT domain-containing protein
MRFSVASLYRFLVLFVVYSLLSCTRNETGKDTASGEAILLQADEFRNQGNNDTAIVLYRQSATQSLKEKQYSLWLRGAFGAIDCLRTRGDLGEAMILIDQTQNSAQQTIDTSTLLYRLILHKKATLFSDKRQFPDAERLFKQNLLYYNSHIAQPDSATALTYNGLGTIYLLQNQLDEALRSYLQALATYEKLRMTHSLNYASTLQNLGIVNSMNGSYEKAEDFFLHSLQVNQDLLKENNPKLASLYLNMGRFYQLIRNDARAIEYLKKAEEYYDSQNQMNSVNAGSLFLNLGVAYIYTADYEKAQTYFDKSLEIISSKTPGNLADLLTIYLNMGFIAEKKGDLTTARSYYLKGLSTGDKLPNSVKVLRGLANVSAKMEELVIADSYHKQALEKSKAMYGEEHTETVLSYLRYGDFLSVTGNPKALPYLTKSIELYKKAFGEISIDVSNAYYYLGLYYFRMKDYEKALANFQQSLKSGFPGFKSNDFRDNPDITGLNLNDNLLNPLTAKATSLLLEYQKRPSRKEYLEYSMSSFTTSLNMIEMLRSTYQDEGSKFFIAGNEKNTYSNAVFSAVTLYHLTGDANVLDQAFTLAEKSKSSVLLSHLRDEEARSIGQIPQKLLNRDAELKSEIYSYNKQIYDQKTAQTPDEAKIRALNSRIFDLSRKQDELIKTIEKNYPVYYNLKYDNSVISIEEIQKKLTDSQAILEYTIADSRLFIFAITQKEKKLVSIETDSTFSNHLNSLREELTGEQFRNYSDSNFITFTRSSWELYKKLIQPVENIITGKELIIIPDGDLGYLSFDILLTQMPDLKTVSYRKLHYLIRDYPLSYAPSATAFFNELNRKGADNNGKILAFAPDYSSKNSVLKKKSDDGRELNTILSPLVNSEEEIKSLRNYFPVRTFTGEAATEEAFKSKASNYRILHLAMHTLINNENPLYSKLVFFQATGDTFEDGLLNASELINMHLKADMAVLSACNTGSGKLQNGEGIISLSRDFFYAGVPGVIMTAWAAEDRSGVKIMENFYKYISQGKPRHEALRLAKLEFLKNCDQLTSHPHYWAEYMNVGDISPLKTEKRSWVLSKVMGLAAIFLFLSLLLYISTWDNKPGGRRSHTG